MTGQHLAHIAGLNLLLHVQQCGADPRLQADCGLYPPGPGQRRQLFGFGGGAAQRPLGVDMLADFDGGPGRRIVRWHPHHHGHRVDLRRGHHGLEIIEGELRSKRSRASAALSGLVVQTAVSSTSGLASSAGKCDWEAQVERTLAPTNPRRILCAMQHAPQSGVDLHPLARCFWSTIARNCFVSMT
jgi:hypothetical protein